VPCRDHTSKALRYGTRSQGISQFYLHTPRTSTNEMNHTCLCLPRRSWYSFTDPGGMEGWVGMGLELNQHPNSVWLLAVCALACGLVLLYQVRTTRRHNTQRTYPRVRQNNDSNSNKVQL